jgi:hypothetical protein
MEYARPVDGCQVTGLHCRRTPQVTALTDMAAPARPGVPEARVPCPLCGGLVHPVAGRCKHCKEDLSTFRAGRPQAAAVLPSLAGTVHPGKTNGHAVATAVVVPVAKEASQPILPPRESARMAAAHDRPSPWRRWPVVVMVLAALAIVAAVIVMVWLPPSSGDRSRALSPPPAPEHMQTNPLPPPAQQQQQAPDNNAGDPWGPAPHAQNTPRGRMPDPIDPLPDLKDPFADTQQVDPFGPVLGAQAGGFMATVASHVCDKLTQCGIASDPNARLMCSTIRQLGAGAPPTCDAQRRCLQHIDQMSCNMQSTDPMAILSLVERFQDCTDAASC